MEKEELVSVSKRELAAFVEGASKVRSAFILCAPRFASGSFGEAAVVAAHQLASTEAKFAELLKGGVK